jgi:hypothetical protein
MDENLSFSDFFESGPVKVGRKVSASSRPEIILATTKDKFIINNAALALMGLEPGDRIAFYDRFGKPDAKDLESRFYVTKGFEYAGGETGAAIGNNKTFSYAGIYSGILAGDANVLECTPADLVRLGLGRIKENGRFISNTKIRMEVVPFSEAVPLKGLEPQMMFALKNFEYVEYDNEDVDFDVPSDDSEENDD